MVTGSIVRMNPGGPAIEASQSLDIEYRSDASGAAYVQSALASISSLIDSLVRSFSVRNDADKGRIGAVHFILSSPWIISQAKTISLSFDRDTQVTPERIHKILEAERPHTGLNPDIPARIIEEKVFDVRLNGYSIAEWEGKSARSLEISYALSVGSEESIRNLSRTVDRLADARHVHFHSSLLLQYMSLRQASIPGDPYMLIHVHGELTDVVAVRHGMCSFFGSFPTGCDTLVRKIAAARRVGKNAAESIVSLYVGKHMDSAEEARTGVTIHHTMHQWLEGLSGLARSMGDFAPMTVFLIAHSHEELFDEALRTAYPQTRIQKLSVDMMSAYASAISVIS